VIKRSVIIGTGTVILVIGLTCLALLQTGVIYPPASIGPVNLAEVKSPEPAAESGQQAPGTPNAPSQPPALSPESGGGPSAQGGLQQPPAGIEAQKPIPVPQVGKGERRYPGQLGQPQTTPKSAEIDKKRRQTAEGLESKHYAHKYESERHAHKYESERHARKTAAASAKKPVVIKLRFDPARNRQINVARVHKGDKIKMKVRRVGHVDRRIYLTYGKKLDSEQGAVLKLGTKYSAYQRSRHYPNDRGYYVIEMRIYPGNRWNIKPRSFV
jgi:hypothetical protein